MAEILVVSTVLTKMQAIRPWLQQQARRVRFPVWTLPAALYLTVLAAPWVALTAVEWSENQAYERLAAQGRSRLTLYGATLHSEMEKFRYIPQVLSGDPQVVGLLTRPDPARAQTLNLRLETIAASTKASAIYVMDQNGLTLSASNWADGSGSFVGQRFDFRPYFTGARDGRAVDYFALGTTSNLPGYYMAAPILQNGQFLGVVAAKMSLDDLERGWSGGGERVFVADRHGVVFITNTPKWRYRTLMPLTAEDVRVIQETRQFGENSLLPLGLVPGNKLVTLNGQGYVMVSQTFEEAEGGSLNVLLGVKDAQAHARDVGMLAVMVLGLTIFVLYFLVQRGQMLRSQKRELELRVGERTAELQDSNQRLQGEIVERHRAEAELQAKQSELVQAAKLAALGQMSAGMAHEINQPLAAIRSYADNGKTFLSMGRLEMVAENLGEIADLTERMARITGQLKQFARKSSERQGRVVLADAIEGSLALLAPRMRGEQVTLDWTPPAEPVVIQGDDVRVQQVLVNLFGNALDAMRGQNGALLRLGLRQDAPDLVSLVVQDNGPGIPDDVMHQMFDPFFTTKSAGEGLGLGLSISQGIVQEMGGTLSAANHPDGGAQMTLTLRRAETV